jgi:hypothetical protein
MGNARLGWVAALAFAVSPLSIQYAHSGAVDTLLVFWIVLATLLGVWAWTASHRLSWFLAGFALGFAVATKVTGLLWGLMFVVAALGYWNQRQSRRAGLSLLLLSSMGALVGVFFGSPYYLLDLGSFKRSIETLSWNYLATFNWQFLKTSPFVFDVEQLGSWAIGWPLAMIGLLGLVWLLRDSIWEKERFVWLIVLVPAVAYFAYVGSSMMKPIRYLLPVVPWVCLCVVQPLAIALKSRLAFVRWGTFALTVSALSYSGVLGTAVSNVYSASDPRVAASEWMLENIPAGAAILHDPEPLITLPLSAPERFQIHILDLYGNRLRHLNNVEWFAQSIQDHQYIVIVSRRHYATILYLDALFPVAACYYRSLFDGNLGYKQIARFSNYPHLGPFVWNTDAAEETFQVFDHPNVLVFERQQILKVEEIGAVLERCVSQ